MRDAISECEQEARSAGLAAGLALALDGADERTAPGSVAALPAGLVPAGTPLVRHQAGEAEGIRFVQAPARRPPPGPELTAALTTIGARLGQSRLGLTSQFFDHVVAHLASRTAGGEPLIRKQLVAGTLADAQLTVDLTRRCLRVAGHSPVAVADAHAKITAVDWELARMLGASGYVGPGLPARAFVSRLIANCWVRREVES
jgi:hypothetical protein